MGIMEKKMETTFRVNGLGFRISKRPPLNTVDARNPA